MKYFCSISVAVLLAVSPVFGQFYEYKDKNGNIVVTDSPPPGVESREKHVQQQSIYHSTQSEVDYPSNDRKDPPRGALQQEAPRKKNYSRISAVMYMTDWCGYCKKAGAYIRSFGANLTEYNIEKDKSKRDEMRQKSGGGTSVPVIDIEGTIIRGYNAGAIKAALDRNAR
jgi:glutaredoxin